MSSTASSPSSSVREKRRSRLSKMRGSSSTSYNPPSLDDQFSSDNNTTSTTTSAEPNNFVTAPPPVRQGKITSGISMLFRRPSNREPKDRNSSSPQKEVKKSVPLKKPSLPNSPSKRTSPGNTPPPPNPPVVARRNSRLFYSSNDDSDDDSYESRVSQSQTGTTTELGEDEEPHNIVRYRGFSTSIKHLFLDESLVCGAIGCFGLILSQRTEYLMNLRNQKRGASSKRSSKKASTKRAPSKIVAYALLLTLLLIGITFCIWGFGSGQQSGYATDYYDGVDYDMDGNDDAVQQYNDDYNNNNNGNDDGYNNNNNNGDDGYGDDDDGYNNEYNDDGYGNRRVVQVNSQNSNNNNSTYYRKHPIHGVFKIRDYQEGLWEPLFDLVKNEWYRDTNDSTSATRVLEDGGGYNDYSGGAYDDYYDNGTFEESKERDIGATVRMGLCFCFFVLLGVVGRRRRMRTRYGLVRARAQEDHLYFASDGGTNRSSLDNTREDQYEGACSHTLCGCYPVDPPALDVADDSSSVGTPTANQKKRKYMDCVSRGFQCLMATCCGALCKCWCQCLSVCALAQEAREVRLLVPPRLQRIDFLTHQPFHEYQKDVNDLRKGWLGKRRPKGGIMPHIYALSQLSRYILAAFVFVFLTIVLTLIFNPRASFSWNDGVVLIATFVQSFIVLYIVHWVFHKSDLSLDAVIKFFAAGFLIATPSAFLFEGLLVNLSLMVVYCLYALIEAIQGESFVNWVIDHYAILWIVGELFSAYVVAAVTEELCKYYTFRTVEHPDLIFLTGLDRKAHEQTAVDGGIASYSFAGHQVSDFNQRVNSFASESEYSRRSNRSKRGKDMDPSERMIDRTNTQEEFYEDDTDVRTYRQQSMAVTTGMISVAVGLACAENFLYVFLLGGTGGDDGKGVVDEWLVLFFRSIFPIHALSAAMQSINMIRKFVECTADNSHNIGVGRIILPAVILHGSFDAVLMGINVYVESSWDKYLEENDGNAGDGEPYNPVVVNLVASISIVVIMLAGVLWYYRENRSQRLRLILLEEKDKAREAEEKDPYPKKSTIPRPSNIELV